MTTSIIIFIAIIFAIFAITIISVSFIAFRNYSKSTKQFNNVRYQLDTNFSGRITLRDSFKIIRNYKSRIESHKTLLPKKKQSVGDTHSMYIGLADFKKYIQYLEELGMSKNIVVNGLRIYFGAYSDEERYGAKRGMQTIVVFPTAKNTKKDVEFDALDLESSRLRMPNFVHDNIYSPSEGLKSRTNLKDNSNSDPEEGFSSALNDMNSSPPRQPH